MTVDAAVPTLDELRTRVTQMQGRPAAQPVRTHPALAGVLELQTGSSYVVESASLATMLLAGPSADGAWCGVVGSAELGLEAAAAAGVELSRTILVPDPGDAWLEVTAALIDVLGIVVVRPPARVSEGDAARLGARLRQRGSILVALPMKRATTGRDVTPGSASATSSGSASATGTDTCGPGRPPSRSAGARRHRCRRDAGCPTPTSGFEPWRQSLFDFEA